LKPKSTLSTRLTNRYHLVIRNEENFEEKTSVSFNYARVLVITTASFAILFCLSFYLSSTILARWFHPASKEVEINKKLLLLSDAVDSLSRQLEAREKILLGVSKVIEGENGFLKEDSLTGLKTSEGVKEVNIDAIDPVDAQFRKSFESAGTGIVRSVANVSGLGIQDMFLFNPVEAGIISDKFNPRISHYGLDLVAKKDEPIRCVADGTVILASWTHDTGHVITVQHAGNLVSVYKHNSVLLKKEGNLVKAGEAIAIIGNSGQLTTGPHLHFELWHNSNPVDPEQLISF
jgi:murein DD-endopeptidase MepM/ murein hydrolase activator NlpD